MIQDRIWSIIAKGSNYLRDIVVAEVLQVALSAGLGSEKAECAGEILVTMSSLSVRGKLVARLRKVSLPSRILATLKDQDTRSDVPQDFDEFGRQYRLARHLHASKAESRSLFQYGVLLGHPAFLAGTPPRH